MKGWIRGVGLPRLIWAPLTGLVVALLARGLGGFPNCPTDETNWAVIALQIDQGVDWPISGPMHFWLMHSMARMAGLSYPKAQALLGVVSVPVLLALLMLGFKKLDPQGWNDRPLALMATLSCSSYFLAPMLESRPQQWGQVLVLLGLVFAWRALNRQGRWWPMALLMLLTASVHILSFAIFVIGSLLLWNVMFVLRRVAWCQLAQVLMSLIVGLAVFVLPDSPYSSMLRDLQANQFRFSTSGAGYVVLAGLLSGALVLALLRQQMDSLAAAARWLMADQTVWLMSACGLLAAVLLMLQARALPMQAWAHYGGSIWFFALFQAGNIFFAGLFFSGLLTAWRARGPAAVRLQAQLMLLLCLGLIAAAGMFASQWMLESNWLLRVLNYGMLFMAPLAADGFDRIRPAALKWGSWVVLTTISLLSVIKPPAIFSCA